MSLETEAKLNIYQKLLAVMREVRYIEKEKKTVNNQYRFVSHDAVTAATSDAFIKHGVYAKPRIVKSEISTIEIERYNKYEKVTTRENNFVCNVEIEYDFINAENPEDKITGVNGLGQGIDNQDKACGKAISYACKYALLKALGIETGDDPEKDVDYKITEQPKNKTGLKPSSDLANGDDMKETMSKKNQEDFNGLKQIIENCGGEEELKEVWMNKENAKIINSLKKWRPELYDLLVNAKDAMKESFKTEEEVKDGK